MPTPVLLQTPAPVPAPVNVPIEVLQSQLSQLSQQLAGLRAQQDVLVPRIRSTQHSDARALLEAQSRDLGAQITSTEMTVAGLKAQIGARVGVPGYQITSTGTVAQQWNQVR